VNHVIIDSRFCGPPDSGNGGYTCGLIANFIDGPTEVILRRKPPLSRRLNIEKVDNGKIILLDEKVTIAEARPTNVEIDIPIPPSFSKVEKSAAPTDLIDNHQYPSCFVCGPLRKKFDGLRIFPGPVQDTNNLAAPWIPDASLSDHTGKIRPEFIWAALDCPGGWAVVNKKMRPILLGKLAVQITNRMKPDDKCVVIAWKISEEGRKIIAGSALFSDSGQLYAKARATWIELKSKGGK
jgi:hypothetical protein